MNYNCLIIDDEIDLAKATCEYFQMFDISCTYVEDSKGYEEFMRSNTADLLLLDINLKEDSGFTLCKKIRETTDIPILFISARQSDDDVLIALNIGGDDYIKKPYTLSVLLAKVKVTLKRLSKEPKQQAGENIQEYGSIRISEDTMRVYIGGKEVQLKPREFKLFLCLFQNKNTIVSKERLFTMVWGDSYFSDSTLNVHIRRLREKIEENPNEPKLIKTIWGTGYMLEI